MNRGVAVFSWELEVIGSDVREVDGAGGVGIFCLRWGGLEGPVVVVWGGFLNALRTA